MALTVLVTSMSVACAALLALHTAPWPALAAAVLAIAAWAGRPVNRVRTLQLQSGGACLVGTDGVVLLGSGGGVSALALPQGAERAVLVSAFCVGPLTTMHLLVSGETRCVMLITNGWPRYQRSRLGRWLNRVPRG